MKPSLYKYSAWGPVCQGFFTLFYTFFLLYIWPTGRGGKALCAAFCLDKRHKKAYAIGMLCLSVQTVHAYPIIYGVKDVENRTWKTDYRGRLYIHASGQDERDISGILPGWLEKKYEKEIDEITEQGIAYKNPVPEWYRNLNLLRFKAAIEEMNNRVLLRANAIIGHVDLVDIIKNSTSVFAEQGQFHWVLKNPVVLKQPILQIKGKLRLWEYKEKGGDLNG